MSDSVMRGTLRRALPGFWDHSVPADGTGKLASLVRAEQVRGIERNFPIGALSAFAGALVLAAVLYLDSARDGFLSASLALWLSVMAAAVAWHIRLCRRCRRSRPADRQLDVWISRFVSMALVEGLVWGLGAVVLSMVDSTLAHQFLILLVAMGVAACAVLAFGSHLPAFYAMFYAITLPYPLWCLAQPDTVHWGLALLIAVFAFCMTQLAQSFNSILLNGLHLRFANDELVATLRVQKRAAEHQKEVAERANQAKTRFLANANHDLRQPIQALNLDTATLKACLKGISLDGETSHAVGRIDAAAKSLSELLTSLLDLSRLDADLVEVHATSFPIGPLLQSLRDEYRAEAEGKGLELIVGAAAAVVHTDRVQLRRILANLISNAIRYTDQGRVAVRCRERGGLCDRVDIWVCDTGRGIPPDKTEVVFEEFQQLDNPGRDRSMGLGLGLFIVKRLSALLECDLRLRSKPGHGSVFTLSVPWAGVASAAVPPEAVAPTVAPAEGLILVVDDEAAIREAMGSLLSAWGYQVLTAGSGAVMLQRIADLDCRGRPVLIISDYRLRGDENGISVVQCLRSEYNEDIPAILLTGDTAPDRLKAASSSGLFVLHKPIDEFALRTAIGDAIHAPFAAAPE